MKLGALGVQVQLRDLDGSDRDRWPPRQLPPPWPLPPVDSGFVPFMESDGARRRQNQVLICLALFRTLAFIQIFQIVHQF